MPLPTPQQYAEAVQNPNVSFSDPALKTGNLVVNPLGLPVVMSGNFAAVFRVKCGTQDWAIKCFTRDVADPRQRYDAMSKHLSVVKLPYTVGFEYLAQGIRVNGNWYPIVKMEWVSGQSLSKYIEQHLPNSQRLYLLADRWIELNMHLRKARVAHGDLQHGNILVVHDDFKLIDYDDMYVPALAGFESNITGDRNYQHPDRTKSYFDETIDAFSDWIIYLSLVALSIDSTLWSRTQAGEENGHLIFAQRDFVDPFSSDILAYLRDSSDLRLQRISSFLTSLSCSDIRTIPTLDPSVLNSYGADTSSSSISVPTPGMPSWMIDHLGPPPGTIVEPTPSNLATAWIFDYLESESNADLLSFRQQIVHDRRFVSRFLVRALVVGIRSTLIGLLLTPLLLIVVMLPIVCSIWLTVALAGRYRAMPSVYAAKAARDEEHKQHNVASEAERALQAVHREHAAIDKRESDEMAALASASADEVIGDVVSCRS